MSAPVGLLFLVLSPPPAIALSLSTHEAIARAARTRLPDELSHALRPMEAHILDGLRDAHSDPSSSDAEWRDPEETLRDVQALALQLGACDEPDSPYLARMLGKLAVETTKLVTPFGAYGAAYGPPFRDAYYARLDKAAPNALRRRRRIREIREPAPVLRAGLNAAITRQSTIRTDAEAGFPGDSHTVTTAGETVNEITDLVAEMWATVLAQDGPADQSSAAMIGLSLEQVRSGVRQGEWLDVERGLERLASRNLTAALTPASIDDGFFTMNEQGADCALYDLALEVDRFSTRLRTVRDECGAAPAPVDAIETASASPDDMQLPSAEQSGIRVSRHQRGHYHLSNTNRELGPEFVALNFTPIDAYPGETIVDIDLEAVVRHYADVYNVEPAVVKAVIEVESDFDPHVVSSAGARGLMQLMPGTALEMGVEDIFNPAENIGGGTQYLALMLDLFDDDLSMALAAYNAGPGTVRRYQGMPPYAETQAYVPKVLAARDRYQRTGEQVEMKYGSKRPESDYLPTPAVTTGATVVLRNGLTMRGSEVREVDEGVWLITDRGSVLVPQRNVQRVIAAEG